MVTSVVDDLNREHLRAAFEREPSRLGQCLLTRQDGRLGCPQCWSTVLRRLPQ
jgi:hypothetical protein